MRPKYVSVLTTQEINQIYLNGDFHLTNTSGTYTPERILNMLIRDFDSVKLPAQSMTYVARKNRIHFGDQLVIRPSRPTSITAIRAYFSTTNPTTIASVYAKLYKEAVSLL
jgi:hypothetical protein